MKKLYWEDEMPIFNLKELNEIKKEGIVIDSIVTHTAPSFADPTEKINNVSWTKDNKKLANEAKKEREIMDNLFNYFVENNIELKFWIYGHFHIESFKRHNNVLFFALSNNYVIFDVDGELEKYQNFVNARKKMSESKKRILDDIPFFEDNSNDDDNNYEQINLEERLRNIFAQDEPRF